MSIAAGLGALGEGFVRGVRIGSDLADSEKRRGLQDLQAKQAQLALDRDTKLNELNTQLSQEFNDFRDGKGAYAPAEGQMYDRTSPQAADLHYGRITPLLQQQAALAGKNPALVEKEMRDLRREGYAENVFRAAQLMEAGDIEGGTSILKPLYNRMFADGTEVKSVGYDRAKDALLMTTVRDGKESAVEMPRSKVVDMLNFGALRTDDAVKLRMRLREKADDREFEGQQRGLDRTNRKEISAADNASAERRTVTSGEYGLKQARITREGRDEYRKDQNKLTAINDFEKDLDNALGANNRSSGIPMSPEERSVVNASRSAGKVAFDSTYDVLGTRITGPQFIDVMEGFRAGKALVRDDKESGLRGIEYNGVRVVVPITSGLFAPQKK